jgi:ribosomal protein S8
MEILIIPASSASSERVFSTAGYILNKKRTRLTSKHLDILIFLKYQLDKKKKLKKKKRF